MIFKVAELIADALLAFITLYNGCNKARTEGQWSLSDSVINYWEACQLSLYFLHL